MSIGKIHISRHVIFDKLDFPFAKPSTIQPPCYVSPLIVSFPYPPSELVLVFDVSVSISSSEVALILTTQPLFSHVPTPCHSMTMRAKNGIFKPKIFLFPTETIFPPPCESNSFKEAAKVPEW
ncbi:hypothetical protein AAG906_020639 [Vitis piasezkii]